MSSSQQGNTSGDESVTFVGGQQAGVVGAQPPMFKAPPPEAVGPHFHHGSPITEEDRVAAPSVSGVPQPFDIAAAQKPHKAAPPMLITGSNKMPGTVSGASSDAGPVADERGRQWRGGR